MDNASLLRLLALSAIWGASFLFMRIGAPVIGPELLVFVRVALAALFLLGVGCWLKQSLQLRAYWRHFLILGLCNTVLPFLCFAWAAMLLPASLLSILNATAPLWGSLLGALWTRSVLPAKVVLGLLLGMSGVAVLAGIEMHGLPPGGVLALLAALAAPFFYGIASTYARTVTAVPPLANAHGSMWAACLLMAPVLYFVPLPAALPAPGILAAVLALGVLCSGVAYLLYFRLIADVGAASALTVTFLIPMFGVFWGWLFLAEPVGWHTVAGSVLILFGTALTTGFSIRGILASRGARHA